MNRKKIVKELYEFKKQTGKSKFVAQEFIYYLEEIKGYELTKTDKQKINHALADYLPRKRVEMSEYDKKGKIKALRTVYLYEF